MSAALFHWRPGTEMAVAVSTLAVCPAPDAWQLTPGHCPALANVEGS
jgi:hypothetical protein